MRSSRLLFCITIFLVTGLLYGAFLWNPIVFDDGHFFTGQTAEKFGYSFEPLTPRWLPYATLGWTDRLFGLDLNNFRIGNLLLHSATAIALFLFLTRLFQSVLTSASREKMPFMWIAFFAALLFSLHPTSVYGAGYLIQRTIIMATLFSLLSLHCYLKGLNDPEKNGVRWFISSALFYLLAVLSKEHSVMLPGVALAITLLLRTPSWKTVNEIKLPFILFTVIAIFITLKVKGVIGAPYEPLAMEMLQKMAGETQLNTKDAYPLSIITQGALFFKYLLLWVLPSPAWMSVDMREPFAAGFLSPHTIGFILFLLYPVACIRLLLSGKEKGLLGFALLSPWILFITELSTVRIQEPFVLYRSYLWAPCLFAALPYLLSKLSRKHATSLLIIISISLTPLAWNRLNSFSHSLYLWDDAALLIQGKDHVIGADRIYFNRGNAYSYLKKYAHALEDYNKVIAINPQFTHAYQARGNVYYKQEDFSRSLSEFNDLIKHTPDNPTAHLGRGLNLESLGQNRLAFDSFKISCAMGHPVACKKL